MIISLHHDVLGDVTVSYRRNSRNYTARWKNGSVYMSVPYGASSRQIVDILDRLAPRLVASRPSECSLHPGSVLDLDSLTIDIRKPASSFSARTMVSLKPPSADTAYKYRLTLTLADDVDTSSPSYPAFVSRAIISSLDPVAADILVNLGRRHADSGRSSVGVAYRARSAGAWYMYTLTDHHSFQSSAVSAFGIARLCGMP